MTERDVNDALAAAIDDVVDAAVELVKTLNMGEMENLIFRDLRSAVSNLLAERERIERKRKADLEVLESVVMDAQARHDVLIDRDGLPHHRIFDETMIDVCAVCRFMRKAGL